MATKSTVFPVPGAILKAVVCDRSATFLLQNTSTLSNEDVRPGDASCDVVMKGSEETAAAMPCHRSVLSCCSGYFRTMFSIGLKECYTEEVQLENVSSEILKTLIDFAYSLEISVHKDNVMPLLAAAVFLEISPVADACWEYLERHLDETNCLMIYRMRHCQIHRENLAQRAWKLVLRHVSSISHDSDLLELDEDTLIRIILSDNLNVDSEDDVLDAVFRWSHHDLTERRSALKEILQFIRRPFLSSRSIKNNKYKTVVTDKTVDEQNGAVVELNELSIQDQATNREMPVSSLQQRPRKFYDSRTVIVCVGGEVDRRGWAGLDCMNCFDPVDRAWSVWAPAPYPVCGAGLVNMGNQHLFLCGGYLPSGKCKTLHVHRYDLKTNDWEQMAPMQAARSFFGAVEVHGLIYAFGGYDPNDKPLCSVERYDPVLNRWQFMASLPMPLGSFAAAAHNGRIYTFGGCTTSNKVTGIVFCYDPPLDSWSELATMPTNRYLCSACIGPSGQIYVIGGRDRPAGSSLTCVEAYDTSTDSWLTKGDMNTARCCAAIVHVEGTVFALGGFGINSNSSSVERYYEESDNWTMHESPLPHPQCAFGCVTMQIRNG
ncbi:kelch-like protein 12 [Paramacrobiotus metropolitanus]|uniref:kelch-like protein 12 n=1 Tax=Paramacrobiotus metropolitanus TaxID=2943436 RepID=UPI00244657E6|nr:kelch-like protein 12 [Paramacrobiotus metropolitanus]